MTPLQNKIEEAKKRFDEKFLYWVVLGSTLNDGSELGFTMECRRIEKIKSFLEQELSSIATLAQEEAERKVLNDILGLPKGIRRLIAPTEIIDYAKEKGITLSNNTQN